MSRKRRGLARAVIIFTGAWAIAILIVVLNPRRDSPSPVPIAASQRTPDALDTIEREVSLHPPEDFAVEEELGSEAAADAIPQTPDHAPLPSPPRHTPEFLPEELAVLGVSIHERLAEFDAASPTQQLHEARELLAHSIAVILCARGEGPIPRGMPGDQDVSLAGQGGRWSFQVNYQTFHFDGADFPEYAEYVPLLRSAYDDEMVLASTAVELPERLAEDIRLRAYEAISWL